VAQLIADINTANGNDEADTINLTAGATYTLVSVNSALTGSNGLPIIALDGVPANSLTINGNGATITRDAAAPTFRFLAVDTNAVAILNDLTLTNGNAVDSNFGGGAIFNSGGTLTLNRCTLSGNSCDGFGGAILSNTTGALNIADSTISGNSVTNAGGTNAGGISNFSGTLTMLNSTVSGNIVTSNVGATGGGIENRGTMVLTNCTISGNQCIEIVGGAGYGGGAGIGLYSSGTSTLTNCTISGNSFLSPNLAKGGGGIRTYGNTNISLCNCIVAGNTSTGVGPDVLQNVGIANCFNNLIGNGVDSNFVGQDGFQGNQVGTTAVPIDPLLGPLQNNGGLTLTRALLAGSTAIDRGTNTPPAPALPATDQRDTPFVRIFNGTVDIGAYELQPFPTTIIVASSSITAVAGQSVTFTATVTANAGVNGPATGTVNFLDGTTVIGSGTLAGGVATFTTSMLSAGTHPITAIYVGNATFLTSTSAAINQVITAAPAGSNLLLVTGAGASGLSQVNVNYSDGTTFSFLVYPNGFAGGINVALGDVTGDGIADLVTGAGAGGLPEVKVFDGAALLNKQATLAADFFAYSLGFSGGVNVAVGRVFRATGPADIVTGAGAGGLSQVNVFRGGLANLQALGATPLQPGTPARAFFAWSNGFSGGVTVAVADIDGVVGTDGQLHADIIIGAGPGAAPEVKVFNGQNIAAGTTPGLIADFFAFAQTFSGGVFVAAGDADGDGLAGIVVGAGAGGGPQVSSFKLNAASQLIALGSFFAFSQGFSGGARVAMSDMDGDGVMDDILVGAGPGGGPQVNRYSIATLRTGNTMPAASFFALPQAFTGGVFVAGNRLF